MIREKNISCAGKPDFEITGSPKAKRIQNAIILTGNKFIGHIAGVKKNYKLKVLNEKQLTQEFVALLRRTLKNQEFPFCLGQEYSDICTEGANTKRAVDFYFYSSEEDRKTKSIYSVEAKRLPSPTAKRKRKRIYNRT
jgi:hypothetical protein